MNESLRLAAAVIGAVWGCAAGLAGPPERTLGVDVIELVAGREVAGKTELAVEHEGYTYLFGSEKNKAAFEADPARFEVADGGACGSMGPLSGLGDARRHVVHEGRVWLFASDGCRDTFLKDPGKCIEGPEDVPAGTDGQRRDGERIIDRAIGWAGGQEAISQVRTYRQRVEKTVSEGGRDWKNAVTLVAEFPGRFARRDEWDERWWTMVSTPGGGAKASEGSHEQLAEARRRAFDRIMARLPIVILKARSEPGFVAVADGAGEIDGAEVDFVKVAFGGATSRLAVERRTGRLVQLAFRGRDGTAFVGDSVRTFTAYTTASGVTLPSAWKTSFNGKESERLAVTLDGVEINPALDAATFAIDR